MDSTQNPRKYKVILIDQDLNTFTSFETPPVSAAELSAKLQEASERLANTYRQIILANRDQDADTD